MAQIHQHPSIWLGQYYSYLKRLLLTGLSGIFWALAIAIFIIQVEPLEPIEAAESTVYKACLIYSWLAALHGLYTILAALLSHFLASLRWLQVAAIIAAIPGLGIFFGLAQLSFALNMFRDLRHDHWPSFFAWRRHRAA